MSRLFLCICCLGLSLSQAGEHKFWEKEDPSSWTPQQITQFTTSSPWARQVTAVLASNDSNMATGTTRGGIGGRSSGVGSGGGQPSPAALPKWEAVVRWASAKPMQDVLHAHLPETFNGHYVVSVSGLPISAEAAEMLDQTTLQVKRGDPVHPELGFQDPNDTSTIYFAFLPSMLDLTIGRSVVFNMLASPYEIRARFNLAEMKYHGEPAR